MFKADEMHNTPFDKKYSKFRLEEGRKSNELGSKSYSDLIIGGSLSKVSVSKSPLITPKKQEVPSKLRNSSPVKNIEREPRSLLKVLGVILVLLFLSDHFSTLQTAIQGIFKVATFEFEMVNKVLNFVVRFIEM